MKLPYYHYQAIDTNLTITITYVYIFICSAFQIDFWNPETITQVKPEMRVDFRVEADKSSDVESLLEQSGVEYEILIDNLKMVLDAQFDSHVRATGHNYEKYNNWETIAAWTADIAAQNANLVSRTEIGTTFQGRPIYLLKVGKSGSNKKAIFMDCGFHAREWISPAFCQWFVKEAVSTYGSDTLMTRLLNNLDFYVLPVLNIDGYVYTWTNVCTLFFLNKNLTEWVKYCNYPLVFTCTFRFSTACGGRHVPQTLAAAALVPTPTGILMLGGAVSIS
ncbi:hypothetical protein KIL84_022963 [Mauremys mutica]|uniref:Carboxypeptidase B n=1 Tax=Mauremys mutica TaxID=74926 RepID=A0A9D4APF2_9SAUR|nr:hypothetical protein KIL84_022963 [Mauremys mutica]